MTKKLTILAIAFLATASLPAFAQGGGGGGAGGGAAGGAGGGSSAGSSTNGSTSGTNSGSNATATNNNGQPAAKNEGAISRAVTGANTAPAATSPGSVSAPGVGVGHAADGLPIGSNGSGPGSPEEPIGSVAAERDSQNAGVTTPSSRPFQNPLGQGVPPPAVAR